MVILLLRSQLKGELKDWGCSPVIEVTERVCVLSPGFDPSHLPKQKITTTLKQTKQQQENLPPKIYKLILILFFIFPQLVLGIQLIFQKYL